MDGTVPVDRTLSAEVHLVGVDPHNIEDRVKWGGGTARL